MRISFRRAWDKICLLEKKVLGKQRDMDKGLFYCLGTNKKIITEYEQIQEKESVADKT